MNELVSPNAFFWFLTLATGVVSALWIVWDLSNLVRARNLDRADPLVRDRHFGYAMGLVMGSIGVLGTLKAHGVF